MSTLGEYHEYIRGCSVHRGISWCMWGISWVHQGMFSTSGDIMIHVGEQVGKNLSISIENPDVLNIPQCTHDITPMYSWYPPMYSWYPPDVLNIPRCTHGIPHMHHDIPRCTHDIPLMYSWYPPWCTEHPPMYSWHPPMYSWYPPNVLMVSRQCTEQSPDALNTHYTGWEHMFWGLRLIPVLVYRVFSTKSPSMCS